MVANLKKGEKVEDLGEELADVLFVLLSCNQTGVDLEKSFNKKMKKSKRDKTRHINNKN